MEISLIYVVAVGDFNSMNDEIFLAEWYIYLANDLIYYIARDIEDENIRICK
jgi:hypothetical protein